MNQNRAGVSKRSMCEAIRLLDGLALRMLQLDEIKKSLGSEMDGGSA